MHDTIIAVLEERGYVANTGPTPDFGAVRTWYDRDNVRVVFLGDDVEQADVLLQGFNRPSHATNDRLWDTGFAPNVPAVVPLGAITAAQEL